MQLQNILQLTHISAARVVTVTTRNNNNELQFTLTRGIATGVRSTRQNFLLSAKTVPLLKFSAITIPGGMTKVGKNRIKNRLRALCLSMANRCGCTGGEMSGSSRRGTSSTRRRPRGKRLVFAFSWRRQHHNQLVGAINWR